MAHQTLSEFLHAVADAIDSFEPETLHPYDGAVYAAAEAQQHAQEVAA